MTAVTAEDAELAVEGSEPDCPAERSTLLEPLRLGWSDEVLFLVPGLEGETEELAPLVAAFSGPQAVIAVIPPTAGSATEPELGVPQLASAMLVALRSTSRTDRTGSAAIPSEGCSLSRWPSSFTPTARSSTHSS